MIVYVCVISHAGRLQLLWLGQCDSREQLTIDSRGPISDPCTISRTHSVYNDDELYQPTNVLLGFDSDRPRSSFLPFPPKQSRLLLSDNVRSETSQNRAQGDP
jgi:hypothetical protein